MDLAHFRMLINELLKKDPDIVPEEAPLVVLYSKSALCMDKNVKDTKHKILISMRVFLRNRENLKMHKIYWCVGGLKLADIATKNLSEPDLTPRMKYIMVRLEKRDITLVQEG